MSIFINKNKHVGGLLKTNCALVALLSAAFLQANAEVLTVRFTDGTSTSIELESRPRVTFNETSLAIRADGITTDYDIAEVQKFEFGQMASIGLLPPGEGETRFSFPDRDNVNVSGLNTNETVIVSDLGGRIVHSVNASASGTASLDLSKLTAGVYVIATQSGKTVKIIRK